MNLKSQLSSLDKLVAKGKIIEAFEKYFSEDVVTYSSESDKTTSKEDKLELLQDFFKKMKSLDYVKFHDHVIYNDLTYSKFTFIFTNDQKERLKWHEIIRRKWKNNLVIEEYYYHEKFSKLRERLAKQAPSSVKSKKQEKTKTIKSKRKLIKEVAQVENKIIKTSEATSNVSETPARKKHQSTTNTTKEITENIVSSNKAAGLGMSNSTVETQKNKIEVKLKPRQKIKSLKKPDLTRIEGIGPKIKELLQLEGINNFTDLSKAKPSDIRAILLKRGGNRYNIHNPETWPEQATLAAKGAWKELEDLKDVLKGGKR